MTVRPAEAAGLVLIRERDWGRRSGGAEVLLGRRHRRARFMPGVYVFPGGRLHAADRRPSGFEEALTRPSGGLDARSRNHLAVFARAALRETFEETGLLIAADARPARRPGAARASPVWAAYRRAGLAPAFDALRLVARAITPARSPLRFHTRFFLADGAAASGRLGGDGELEDLRWVPVGEAGGLPMAEVTGLVLEEARLHRAATTAGRTPALFAWDGRGARPRHRREDRPPRT